MICKGDTCSDLQLDGYGILEGGDERNAQFFVDHKGQDSHHGSSALVQFNGTLLELGGFIKGVPAVVDGTVTEVTNEFGISLDVTHDHFQKEDKANDLAPAFLGDSGQGTKSAGDIGKGCAGVVNVTGQTDSGGSDQVTNNGQHGDAAVLEFDFPKTFETGGASIVQQTQRIVETKL